MSTIVTDPIDQNALPYRPAPVWGSALKWGAIAGVVSSILTLISYNLGFMAPSDGGMSAGTIVVSVLSFALLIGFIYVGMKAYRDADNGGRLTLGRGVLWSLAFGVGLAVVSTLFILLFYQVLAPDLLEEMMEAQLDALAEEGMDEAEMEAVESVQAMTLNPITMAVSSLLTSLITPLIFGTIISFVLRNDK